MARKAKFIDKKTFKKVAGKCHICGEDNIALLDKHRIIPGSQKGKYSRHNSVCLCVKCHRKVHTGQLEIDGWYDSTKGRMLRIFEDGVERFC